MFRRPWHSHLACRFLFLPLCRTRPQVRAKQESKRNCAEDLHNLGEHFNATRGAKEFAERELAKVGAGPAPGWWAVEPQGCRLHGETGKGGRASAGRRVTDGWHAEGA